MTRDSKESLEILRSNFRRMSVCRRRRVDREWHTLRETKENCFIYSGFARAARLLVEINLS